MIYFTQSAGCSVVCLFDKYEGNKSAFYVSCKRKRETIGKAWMSWKTRNNKKIVEIDIGEKSVSMSLLIGSSEKVIFR